MQNVNQFVASDDGVAGVDFNHYVLVIALVTVVVGNQLDAAEPGEFFRILLMMAAIDFNKLAHTLEIGQTHGGGDFAHLTVGADALDLVVTGEAEVLHQPRCCRQLIVVGDDGSALKRVYEFRGVKTKDLSVAKAADHSALVRATKRMRGVEEQLQSATFGDLFKTGNVTA